MCRSIVIGLFICFFSIQAYAQPVINSFAPLSGNIGSSVIITGSGFDAIPANNIVFFGAVKATVTSASATSLDVIVPAGATYQPISVTTNGLTAYSTLVFNTTFTSATPVTANSFRNSTGLAISLAAGSSQRLITSDFDGDGKPDIVTLAVYDSISVFRNTSSGGAISFGGKRSFPTSTFTPNFSVADYNGDGKPDLACINNFSNIISVLRNTSTIGDISFAPKIDIPIVVDAASIVSGDINSDGMIDMIISNESDSSVSIFRNTTVGNNISFAANVDLRTDERPRYVIVSDLDGDLLPDIVTTNSSSNSISILKNTSSGGSVSFDPRADIATEANPGDINAVDLDRDMKNDLVITNGASHVISTFLNNSTSGSISFAPRIDYTVITGNNYPPMPWPAPGNTYPISIASGDVNGDGKPDLYIGCSTDGIYPSGKRVLLVNTSSSGNISFAPRMDFIGGPVTSAGISDLQGDGKPEILAVLPTDFNAALAIYNNRVGELINIELCPTLGVANLDAGVSASSYQWQVSTDSINFTDITASSIYHTPNTGTLGLNNIPSSYAGNFYRCIMDGNIIGDVFKIRFVNTWLGNSYGTWGEWGKWSCNDVPDQYTDVIIAGGHVTINSDVTVNTMTVLPGATVTVSPGYNLTILH